MPIITSIIYYLFNAYLDLIILNIILSWFPAVYNIGLFRFLRKLTDSYMGFFKGYLTVGIFDLTPIVGIIIFEGIIYAYASLVPVYDLIDLILGSNYLLII